MTSRHGEARREPGLASAFGGSHTSAPALLLMLALGMLLLGYAGQGLSGEPSWGLTITYVAMVVAALALLAGCATGALRRLRERG
ncbi:hypothetical protein GCM10025872_34290 [Barrientosiimonas endolithica]|uniref:Uncharacterized protein n=2 Tax=Barrientosiimonas endolithica TaxID=1535208 RepID=A0ABM8HFK3_9MICO|nr:hypothetical protein GCM10025872_34290 [Barrientosiimonas endolithica]